MLGGYDQLFEVVDSAGRNLMEIAHLYGQEMIVHFLSEAMNFVVSSLCVREGRVVKGWEGVC